jgi:hypothetical protein
VRSSNLGNGGYLYTVKSRYIRERETETERERERIILKRTQRK